MAKFIESDKLRIIEDLALLQVRKQGRKVELWQLFANKVTRILALGWILFWITFYLLGGIDYKTLMVLIMAISFVWSIRKAIGNGVHKK